jgi:hypothetical protein
MPVEGKGEKATPQFPMEQRKTSLLFIVFWHFSAVI